VQAAQSEGSIDSRLDPYQLFRIIVGSMRLIVSQWNMSNCGFDLQAEGKALLETIVNMIEVKK